MSWRGYDDPIDPLTIERVWHAGGGRPGCRIRWTNAQLRRIGRAVREGDRAFRAAVEAAIQEALAGALTQK
jgi:hypothetical protein